jgi:alkenylglycerophosphocholine/alkenylglycerophosphoethanolamine hydrolase
LPPLPVFALLVVIAAWGVFYIRGLSSGLRKRRQTALLVPVLVYSLMLGLLLLSAWATLFRPAPPWTPWRRVFVITGATLFFVSDSLLAWNRFVEELPHGHTTVMITYHLAQFGLAASIALV